MAARSMLVTQSVCFRLDYTLITSFSKKALRKLRKESRPRAANLHATHYKAHGRNIQYTSVAPQPAVMQLTANSKASNAKQTAHAAAAQPAPLPHDTRKGGRKDRERTGTPPRAARDPPNQPHQATLPVRPVPAPCHTPPPDPVVMSGRPRPSSAVVGVS